MLWSKVQRNSACSFRSVVDAGQAVLPYMNNTIFPWSYDSFLKNPGFMFYLINGDSKLWGKTWSHMTTEIRIAQDIDRMFLLNVPTNTP